MDGNSRIRCKKQQQECQSAVPTDSVLGTEFCPNAISEVIEIFKLSPAELIWNVIRTCIVLHLAWMFQYISSFFHSMRKLITNRTPVDCLDQDDGSSGPCSSKLLNSVIIDCVCSVCNDDYGSLINCERCPSRFHTHCLGLKGIPDQGDWFCPSCCCNFCGCDFAGKESTDEVLSCHQCERRFHDCCVKSKTSAGHLFCGDTCKHVFSGLQTRLGKAVPLGRSGDLTWNLVKFDSSDNDDNLENLDDAVDLLQECFDPCDHNLIEDVIFNTKSKLKRVNYEGFYAVTLKDENEVISAATLRVFGNKVAEVPLVGTNFLYRGYGMCRILMDELENMLKELGVETLVLSSMPCMLKSWTNSYGFCKMNEQERLKFLDYTFLGFSETYFCQKKL